MNKTILIGMTALALALGACGKKTPPADIGPAGRPTANAGAAHPPPTTASTWSSFPACRPTSSPRRARTRSISGPTSLTLDAASRATLAAQARWMLANPSVKRLDRGPCRRTRHARI